MPQYFWLYSVYKNVYFVFLQRLFLLTLPPGFIVVSLFWTNPPTTRRCDTLQSTQNQISTLPKRHRIWRCDRNLSPAHPLWLEVCLFNENPAPACQWLCEQKWWESYSKEGEVNREEAKSKNSLQPATNPKTALVNCERGYTVFLLQLSLALALYKLVIGLALLASTYQTYIIRLWCLKLAVNVSVNQRIHS